MRIALVSALWGPAYPTGSGIYAYEIAKRLAEKGHEVHAMTSDVGDFSGCEYPTNLTVHRFHSRFMMWDMNPFSNPFFSILSGEYDILHVHSYIFFMSNLAALAKTFSDSAYVLNFHGGINHAEMGQESALRIWAKDRIYDRTIGRFTVRLADRVASVSKKDIPLIENKFGVKVDYVPNAVSTDYFSCSENEAEYITYVGKLEKWKGTLDLIKIFKKVHEIVPRARFMVVGEGSLSHEVRSANLPVEFVGHVPHSRVADIYHSSAVTLLPSRMEGCPTTCLESLACGVPVVATDVGDTSEIVKDGRTGFLSKPGSIDSMAEGIVSIVEDENLRKRMGSEGRSHIERNFSYDGIIEKVERLYALALNETEGTKSKSEITKVLKI